MYQANNLPFSVDQPQWPEVMISANDPPVWFNNLNVPQEAQQFIGYATSVLAHQIQSNAMKNRMRMFAFNVYAQNSFNNPDFKILVEMFVMVVYMRLAQRAYNTPQIAIENEGAQFAEMTLGYLYSTFQQGLQGMLTPQENNHMYQMYQMHGQLRNELNQFEQRMAAPVGNNMGMGMGMQGNMGMAGQRMGNYNQTPRQGMGNAGVNSSALNNVFQTEGQGNGQRNTRPSYGDREVQVIGGTNPIDQRAAFTKTAEQPPQQVKALTREIAGTGKLSWTSSQRQRTQFAYQTNYYAGYLQQLDDGIVVQELIALEELDQDARMDYESHRIPTAFGTPHDKHEFDRANEALDKIKQGMQQLSAEHGSKSKVEGDTEKRRELSHFTHEAIISDLSETAVWFQCQAEYWQLAVNGDAPSVFQIRGQVVEAHLVPTQDRTKEDVFVQLLSEAGTFHAAAVVLNNHYAKVDSGLWHGMNRRLTTLVNLMLGNNLSTAIRIGNFCEDALEINSYILKKFGDAVAAVWIANQSHAIKNAVQPADPTLIAQLLNLYETNGEVSQAAVNSAVGVYNLVTMTLLDIDSTDLRLNFDPKRSAQILPEYAPDLYYICRAVLYDTEDTRDYLRHYLRTRDGRTLEIAHGYLGDGAIMITLLP